MKRKLIIPPARWGGKDQAHPMTHIERFHWAMAAMQRATYRPPLARAVYIVPLDKDRPMGKGW